MMSLLSSGPSSPSLGSTRLILFSSLVLAAVFSVAEATRPDYVERADPPDLGD
jgi:hypothetical protein